MSAETRKLFTLNKTINATVPAAANLAEEQLIDFFARVWTLLEACGSDKNGRAIAAISACIIEGINTRSRIVGVLTKLGFNSRHANIMLNGGTKSVRYEVPWRLDRETGRYHLLVE